MEAYPYRGVLQRVDLALPTTRTHITPVQQGMGDDEFLRPCISHRAVAAVAFGLPTAAGSIFLPGRAVFPDRVGSLRVRARLPEHLTGLFAARPEQHSAQSIDGGLLRFQLLLQ